MSFLSPLFLVGAAAAAIPIVLHLLKRRPEARVKFAAVRLLRRAPVEHTDRRRLRELLLLALRVAALVLLALAFARPFFAESGGAGESGGTTIVALDTSFSLAAPGRFERARDLAKAAVSRRPPGERVGVVAFADRAELAVPPSTDRGLALAAIDAAAPGFGGTRYRAGLSLAAETIAASGSASSAILVVTDLQESGWDEGEEARVAADTRLEVVDVGDPPPNLAVTSVRPAAGRLSVVIRNSGGEPREARVRLDVDGRPAGASSATVGPRQSAEVLLAAVEGTAASVTVEDPDGIQADNVRFVVLDGIRRPSVLVVSSAGEIAREAFYLQQAIAASGPDGALYDVGGVAAKAVAGWEQARVNRYAAVVITSTRGLERRGRDLLLGYLQGGGGVLLPIGPEIDADVAADTIGGTATVTAPDPNRAAATTAVRRLAPIDPRHPLFRAFGSQAAALGLATFDRAAGVRAGAPCQSVARFTSGEPAIVDCPVGEGRVLIVASDLNRDWNDLPLHASFVPFVHEALGYLSAGRSHAAEYLVADAPPGVPARPGIATFRSDGAGPQQIAVNVDPRESDPTRLSAEEFAAAVTRAAGAAAAETRLEARQQEERQRIWQYVLALMLGVMIMESLVAARTA